MLVVVTSKPCISHILASDVPHKKSEEKIFHPLTCPFGTGRPMVSGLDKWISVNTHEKKIRRP